MKTKLAMAVAGLSMLVAGVPAWRTTRSRPSLTRRNRFIWWET